jgi:TonB-linked SusC/RagA family outer membrane protein
MNLNACGKTLPNWWRKSLRLFLLMKLCFLILTTAFLQMASAKVHAQLITLNEKDAPLAEVFERIKSQSGYHFFWKGGEIKKINVTIDVQGATIKETMDLITKDLPLNYAISKKSIVILQKDNIDRQEQITIKGRVFDKQEPPLPLPGVSISVKGATQKAATDKDGNFSITVNRGAILVFTMVGFFPHEEEVKKATSSMSISLREDVSALNEVMIMGMNEIQKKHIASAVSSLNVGSNIAGKPITSLGQALQGGVTGIQVNQGSGTPGGDAVTIRIRGITTLNNSNPLILVDGLPMDMNNIDPVTIESVTVLKDAAAAAVYGARAANGVILVNTKRGVPGKMSVVYDGYYAVATPSVMPRVVDAPRYMEMFNEAEINAGNNAPFSQLAIDKTRTGEDPLNYPNTNWRNLIIREYSPLNSNSLSVTGGNSLARFAITANYMNQQGMIPSSAYNRLNFRANTSISFGKTFDVKLDLLAIRRIVSQHERGRLIEDTYRVPPTILPRYPDRDGYTFYGQYADVVNPVAYAEVGGESRIEHAQSSLNFQPRWEVIPNLNLRAQISFRLNSDATRTQRANFVHYDYYTFTSLRTWPLIRTASMSRTAYYHVSATADYTFKMNDHYLFAMGGYTQEENNSGNWNVYSLMSGFGKLNYSYKDKYLLEGTVRTDGSSRFGPGHKFGFFPSAAIGWNVHNEGFMKSLKMVNNLKFRASYGKLGNENISAYLYQSLIDPTTGLENSHGNPDITWETVNMLNLGLDLGLFKQNKVEITFDFYDKITNDIILTPRLPLVGGFESSTPINAGKVKNQGWELSINYNEKIGKNFRFSVRPGITVNKNTILSLLGGPYIANSATTIQQEGYSIGSVYGYKSAGLLQQSDFDDLGQPLVPITTGQRPGDIRYLDLNNNGVIDDQDQGRIGNPTPEVNYFGNLTLNYKNFDLDFLIQGTGKSDVTLLGMFALPLDQSFDGGVPTQYYDGKYWTPERTDAKFPRLSSNPTVNKLSSDFWFQNGAYTRVKYIQLGYSLNKSLVKKMGLSAIRVYINAQNPFTISHTNLTDPESRGNQNTYGITKLYSMGARVNF